MTTTLRGGCRSTNRRDDLSRRQMSRSSLPTLASASITRWASATSSSGKRRSMTGCSRAGGEQRQHLGDEAAADRRSSPRAGGIAGRVPIHVIRFGSSAPDVDAVPRRHRAGRPARSCRCVRTAARLRSTSSPPTTSSTTSTPSTPRSASASRSAASQSAGDRSSDDVGAEVRAASHLAGRARDGDVGADRLGDLDRRRADPRRAGVDERPPPAGEPALHDERVPRGDEDLRDGCRVASVESDRAPASPGGRG